MVEKQRLYEMLEKIKGQVPSREWKYYHLQSIGNFIYHLDSLKAERTRERMANDIERYLELVVANIHEETEVHDKSRSLFPSVWKLADTYKYEVGFVQKPSYMVMTILAVGLFFILKISFATLEAIGACILFLLIYSVYAYTKVKARKVF